MMMMMMMSWKRPSKMNILEKIESQEERGGVRSGQSSSGGGEKNFFPAKESLG